MKNIWSILFLFILCISCNTADKHNSPIDYIPENASVVVQVNNLESLKSNLANNDLINALAPSEAYKSITKKLRNIKYLNTSHPLLLCFYHDANDSLQYTIISKQTPDLFQVDSLQNISVETYAFNNLSINKTSIEEAVSYNTIKDSIFIASSSKTGLETVLSKTNTNEHIKTILKTADTNRSLSILINNTQEQAIKSIFINDSIPFSKFSNYTLLDTELDQESLIFNGITKAKDSTESLINTFKSTIPQENTLAQITPSNADGFMSLTFDDFFRFKDNLKAFSKKDSIIVNSSLFESIVEVGVIYEGDNKGIILNSTDVINTKDALLNDQDIETHYRQVTIYNFSEPQLFKNTFAPFITFESARFYANLDDFFIFSNSIETLQNIIANYQNKTTFGSRDYYKNMQEHLTDESSLLIVANPGTLKTILSNNLNEALNFNPKYYKASAVQFVYDSHFAHVNAIIKKDKAKVRENSIVERYHIKLEYDLLTSPQLVVNHLNRQKEIAVQDVNNNLYLISNRGKVLWKKQLQGAILGEIKQIDIYKNGRLQLAFATKNRVYVLDRNGKDVAPFPLKFNDDITQPLSVFDYDKNKKYRLLVTQDKNLLMYDAKGKTVKGFTFKAADHTINHQPQHFRIGRKDYLTFKTNTKLYILDRTGKKRVTPKKDYNYSDQALYLYKSKFTTTTNNGLIVSVNTNGDSATQDLGLETDHDLVTTTRTLVALSGNRLTIKDKTIELDFGEYDVPKLFYINNKIYVSVTDLQTQRIFVYDSNANLLPNFPVYGNSAIALSNMDNDRNLEFITKGDNNAIIIYEIN